MVRANSEEAKETGRLLRERRKSLGLTQDAVAVRARMARNDVSRAEGGSRPPGPDVGIRLARALLLTPSELGLKVSPFEEILFRLEAIEASVGEQWENSSRAFARVTTLLEHLVEQAPGDSGQGRATAE